ncbi:MAG: hypothetical protein ACRDYX_19095 [Egibacteraceae bacterium]
MDIDPEVAAQARQTLDATGYGRVHVTTGDGALGAPDRAPYDRVIVTDGYFIADTPDSPVLTKLRAFFRD